VVDLPLKEPEPKQKAKIKAVVVTSLFNVSIVVTSNHHILYAYAQLTKTSANGMNGKTQYFSSSS